MKKTPHALLRQIGHTVNEDPRWQLHFSLFMTYFWIVNMIACTIVFVWFRSFFDLFSLFYILQVSLWALVATHFGAVPGAISAIHAKQIDEARDYATRIGSHPLNGTEGFSQHSTDNCGVEGSCGDSSISGDGGGLG